MVEKVEGFLTNSGRFFDHKVTAEYEEAKEALYHTLEESGYSTDLLTMLDELQGPIQRYLEAKKALDKQPEKQRGKVKDGKRIQHVSNSKGQ